MMASSPTLLTFPVAAVVVLLSTATTRVAEAQLPCVGKLVPCANYLNSTAPPASCCDPLREAVKNEFQCLCEALTSPEVLNAFQVNITQSLSVLANCGISFSCVNA